MPDSGETSEPPEERAPLSGRDRFLRLWRQRHLQATAGVFAIVAAVAVAAPYLPGQVGGTKAGSYGSAANSAEAPGFHGLLPGQSTTKPTPPTPEQVATSVNVPTQLAAALRTWNKGPGGKAFYQISNDIGMVLQSGGTKMYVAMKAACGNLATSVNAAATSPPIPDATMQSKYTAALSTLGKAAADCRSAISEQPNGTEYVSTTVNQAVLGSAQNEFSSVSKNLANIAVTIQAATGSA